MTYRSSPSFAVGGVPERPRYRYYYATPPGWSIDDMACRYDPKLDAVELGKDNHFRLSRKPPVF